MLRYLKNVKRDGSFVKFFSNLSLCQFRGRFATTWRETNLMSLEYRKIRE